MTTKQLPGGRVWNQKDEGCPGWESEDKDFDILIGKGYVVLVSFHHEPNDPNSEFWRKRFPSVEAAMDYAERM